MRNSGNLNHSRGFVPSWGIWIGLILPFVWFPVISAHAGIALTGDAPADFAGSPSVIDNIENNGGIDVGLPPSWPFPFSGWDFRALYFDYDADKDTAFFGLDFFGVAGDADGDGEPGISSSHLTNSGGIDLPHLAGVESIALLFDVNQDRVQGGKFEFVVGVPEGNSPLGEPLNCGEGTNAFSLTNCFGLFDVDHEAVESGNFPSKVFFAKRQEAAILGPLPSADSPDFEFAIPQWSALLAKSGVLLSPCEPWSIDVHVFAGSFIDDGVGEDVFPNQGEVVTLNFPVPSPELCMCLEDLNVCEEALTSSLADSDGDGTPDTIDQCPNTLPAVETDLLGCSQKQFCGNFGGKGLRRLYCKAADWKNDEPLHAKDCRIRRGTCIPR